MIDYFKTFIAIDNTARIRELAQNGTFTTATNETDTQTGEVLKEAYYYKNMVIGLYQKGLLIRGSLHKLHNHLNGTTAPNPTAHDLHKGFNGDLFTLSEIQKTIHGFCELLQISPDLCRLQNLEIGLNNEVSFDPKDFLKGLLYHRNNYDYSVKHENNYTQFNHAQYYLKIYNKGRQYGMRSNVLRVEIKVMKMQKLHDNGVFIETLNDINETTLKQAFELLYTEFSEVVYYDYTTATERLTPKQRQNALNYQNKEFWRGLSKVERLRKRQKLDKMILEFSDNLRGQISEQMQSVFYEVLDTENSPEKGQKFPLSYTPLKNQNCIPIYTLNKGSESNKNAFEILPLNFDLKGLILEFENLVKKHPKKHSENLGKKCKVTGLCLGLEKGETKYIRTATIEFLKMHLQGLYFYLCAELLSRTGYTPKRENNHTSQLCKQVRNRFRNIKG